MSKFASRRMNEVTQGYLTEVRRRWIRIPSTITNRAPEIIRMSVTLSMSKPLSLKSFVSSGRALNPRASPKLVCTRNRLLDHRAPALDKYPQHDRKKDTGNNLNHRGAVHKASLLTQWKNVLNDSIMMMTDGPRTTRNNAGKMKNTNGKISLMVVFAAASSTC
jgi:hypothetical protein